MQGGEQQFFKSVNSEKPLLEEIPIVEAGANNLFYSSKSGWFVIGDCYQDYSGTKLICNDMYRLDALDDIVPDHIVFNCGSGSYFIIGNDHYLTKVSFGTEKLDVIPTGVTAIHAVETQAGHMCVIPYEGKGILFREGRRQFESDQFIRKFEDDIFVDCAAGDTFFIAITSLGKTVTFTDTTVHAVGGIFAHNTTPQIINALINPKRVFAFGQRLLVLNQQNQLFAFRGSKSRSPLGTSDDQKATTELVQIPQFTEEEVLTVSGDEQSLYVITTDGSVYSCGDNQNLLLRHGNPHSFEKCMLDCKVNQIQFGFDCLYLISNKNYRYW